MCIRDRADCWRLVDTAEETRRHCMMLENCCYDAFALTTLNMVQQGVLGEITHAEGAYIHDLRKHYFADEKAGGYHNHWIKLYSQQHTGNPCLLYTSVGRELFIMWRRLSVQACWSIWPVF